MSKKTKKGNLIAVFDLGSSAVRFLLAETHMNSWRVLDKAELPNELGQDVFSTGKISRQVFQTTLSTIESFIELLEAYPKTKIIAIGTSALREATNASAFLDQVYRRFDIKVRVLEGIETNQLTFLSIMEALKLSNISIKTTNALMVEVGGGSTEAMLVKRGHVHAAHTLAIGTVRVDQHIRQFDFIHALMRQRVHRTLGLITQETLAKRISRFVAVGSEIRIIAEYIGNQIGPFIYRIERDDFSKFVEKLKKWSIEDIVTRLGITYNDAELLIPATHIYNSFFMDIGAKFILVPTLSIREGIIIEELENASNSQQLFQNQVNASVIALLNHYHADVTHAKLVTKLSLEIFDFLTPLHGLGSKDRMLMEVSGMLHDIGSYINTRAHHKHGQYIIQNSEIFGLSSDEREVVGNIVRYHRKSEPKLIHIHFATLSKEEKVIVYKLASILRIVEALDSSHMNRIGQLDLKIDKDEFIIRDCNGTDLTTERNSLTGKDELFEEVYGLKVVIK
ncbi:MAG: HD domain-containing protein [Lentisphaeria bacterium]|nr:HD domain-containing protein [Lentisphaeria bacterium]